MSNQAKPFTLFDLYAFLGQQLGNNPELANLYVAGLDMPMIAGTDSGQLPKEMLIAVNTFYTSLDAKVDEGISYIENNVMLASVASREDMEAAANSDGIVRTGKDLH